MKKRAGRHTFMWTLIEIQLHATFFFSSLSICRRFFSPTLLTLFWSNNFPRGRFSPIDHPQIARILEYYNSFFSTHIPLHSNVLPKSFHPEAQTSSLNYFMHDVTVCMLQILDFQFFYSFPLLIACNFLTVGLQRALRCYWKSQFIYRITCAKLLLILCNYPYSNPAGDICCMSFPSTTRSLYPAI